MKINFLLYPPPTNKGGLKKSNKIVESNNQKNK